MPLVTTQRGMLLEQNTAAAFDRANAASGDRLRITYRLGAYRSEADQQHLRDLYLAGGNYAAEPGDSPHERGIAVDIGNWASIPNLPRIMRNAGFVPFAPEPWHWNYTGTSSGTAGTIGTPIDTDHEEDALSAAEVKQITDHVTAQALPAQYQSPTRGIMACRPETGYWRMFGNLNDRANLMRLGVVRTMEPIPVSDGEFDGLIAEAQDVARKLHRLGVS